MSGVKDTFEKIRNLEAEKKNLLLEIEELKKMADAKVAGLEIEIATLREDVGSLKSILTQEEKQVTSGEYLQVETEVLAKELKEETPISAKELAQKTLDATNKLGSQIFPLSPFGQYFDNWLTNLRRTISEFESNPLIKLDEQFVKSRAQIFFDVERSLAQKRFEESNLSGYDEALANNNRILLEIDKEHAEKTKELNSKRDAEIESIKNRIRKLETDVASQEKAKPTGFKRLNYSSKEEYNNTKRNAAEKLAQTRVKLKSAQNELEVAVQSFSVDQEVLDEDYEKRKLEISGKVESLRKELSKLKIDTSMETRQAACDALANAINSAIQKSP